MFANRWIIAARPRTLPLSFAGPLLASFLAYAHHAFHLSVAIGSIMTTLFLQVLSNFANDYGDFVKGSDANRKGPTRALQSNLVTQKEMKNAIFFVSILALLSGISLIFLFSSHIPIYIQLIFLIMGLLAIYAAIRYTIGKNAYGYKGWGDVFVFIFFGLVSTVGTYILHTGVVNPAIILPAIALGLLSAGVLNINNIRDYHEDLQHNKRTLVVMMGIDKSRIYHVVLIIVSWLSLSISVFFNYHSLWQFSYVITLPLFIKNIKTIYHFKQPEELNTELKRLAMATFTLAIVWGIGQIF